MYDVLQQSDLGMKKENKALWELGCHVSRPSSLNGGKSFVFLTFKLGGPWETQRVTTIFFFCVDSRGSLSLGLPNAKKYSYMWTHFLQFHFLVAIWRTGKSQAISLNQVEWWVDGIAQLSRLLVNSFFKNPLLVSIYCSFYVYDSSTCNFKCV